MKDFLLSWRINLAWLRVNIYRAWNSADGWLRSRLWAASLSLTAREQAELNQGFLALALEKVWGINSSNARDDHLCYALGTKRRISDMEAIIIPRKIRLVLLQVLPLSRVQMPEAPPLRLVLRLHWSDRTGNKNKIVIRGAQRRGKFNRVSWRVGS